MRELKLEMIKIKLHEIEKHRVETTFRPFLFSDVRNLFNDVGIQFITQGNDWDMLWVAHPTFIKKDKHFLFAVETGIRVMERLCEHGDVVMFDGCDSPSLAGSWDVFKETKAKYLFKNSLYNNLDWYKEPSVLGRYFWGKSDNPDHNYQIDDELYNVKLSGCNWLNTIHDKRWFDYKQIDKPIDICALFSYPVKENWEWEIKHSEYYNKFRKPFIDVLMTLKDKYNIRMIENGQHIPPNEYYQIMRQSKIILAPFGYGEIAPRDFEAVQFGSILMKPDMSHVNTVPNPYNQTTYASIKWDASDMEETVESILSDFNAFQDYYTNNFRYEFNQRFSPDKLVLHTYDWISKMEGYGQC